MTFSAKRKKGAAAAAAKAGTSAAPGTPVQPLGSCILKPGQGKHGQLPPAPPDAYKGLWNETAIRMGFEDLWELTTVQGYLALNGEFSLCEVGLCTDVSIALSLYRLHTNGGVGCRLP